MSIIDDTNSQPSDTAPLLEQEIPAIQEERFVFDFLGCESTPNTDFPLTCDFLVENSQVAERQLYIFASGGPGTRVLDTNGNEMIASSVQLGSSISNSSVYKNMPSKIPLKATLSFARAPEGGIRIIDISCSNNRSVFDVEFRFYR
ncbi:MAG: hypothetical protein AB8B99_11500 [Phormidesmis sp.]